jgi:putative ABC transport system substrate-binding protein
MSIYPRPGSLFMSSLPGKQDRPKGSSHDHWQKHWSNFMRKISFHFTLGAMLYAPCGKRLELLKETIPRLSRVALLWNPQDSSSAQSWKDSQLPAKELGLQLHSMEVLRVEHLETAFKGATRVASGALVVAQSPLASSSNRKVITDLAAKYRLPAIYARDDFAESGGLMSYGADRNAKPADLPVERPTKFELVINLKTAKQIGLTVPPNVLSRADRVIR